METYEIDKDEFNLFVLMAHKKKSIIEKMKYRGLFKKYRSCNSEFDKVTNTLVTWELLYEKRDYINDRSWRTEYILTKKGKRALWAGRVTREWQPLLTEKMQVIGFILSYVLSIIAIIVAICK